jgi:hypothetical protein
MESRRVYLMEMESGPIERGAERTDYVYEASRRASPK